MMNTNIVFLPIVLSTSEGLSIGECSGVKDMAFVAHEDDDLLFMNPDLTSIIRGGHCVRIVYLTAGDGDMGVSYWLGRENGEKAAYAYIAGVNNSWDDTTFQLSGHKIKISTLNENPKVSLVFLRLPDGIDQYRTVTLKQLWDGQSSTKITSVDGINSFNKSELINILIDLMTDFHSTSIRMQDPDPMNFDHQDHINAAKFTDVAQNNYLNSHTVTRYRDYNIQDEASNLSEAESRDKLQTFLTYAAYDSQLTNPGDEYYKWTSREYFVIDPDQGGSIGQNADGRLEVFIIGANSSSLRNIFQTAPSGSWSDWGNLGGKIAATPVVARNQDGRLEAFIRGTDHVLYHTWQTIPNGNWSGGGSLGGIIASDPVVASNQDGRLEVFARGTDNYLYHRWQISATGDLSDWSSLSGLSFTANPAAARNADGRLEVFVRDEHKSLQAIYQLSPNTNSWSDWENLGGAFISDPMVASNADGSLEVFVRGTDNTLNHVFQLVPNGIWSDWENLGGIFSYNPIVARNEDGRLEVFVHGIDGNLMNIYQTMGTWSGWGNLGGILHQLSGLCLILMVFLRHSCEVMTTTYIKSHK